MKPTNGHPDHIQVLRRIRADGSETPTDEPRRFMSLPIPTGQRLKDTTGRILRDNVLSPVRDTLRHRFQRRSRPGFASYLRSETPASVGQRMKTATGRLFREFVGRPVRNLIRRVLMGVGSPGYSQYIDREESRRKDRDV